MHATDYVVDGQEPLYLIATICRGHKYEFAEDRRTGVVYVNTWKGIVPFEPCIRLHGYNQTASWSSDHVPTLDVTKEGIIDFIQKLTDYSYDHLMESITKPDKPDKQEDVD